MWTYVLTTLKNTSRSSPSVSYAPVSSISRGLHGLPGLCREESIGLTNAVHKWVFISNLERAWEMAATPSDTQHYHPKSPHALVGQTNDHQLPKCTIDQLY